MKPADRRPTLDVHHVRHLLFSCTTVLGLTLAGGCGGDSSSSSGANGDNGSATTQATGDGADSGDSGTPPEDTDDSMTTSGTDESTPPAMPADPTANPAPAALPKHCYIDDASAWVGQPWRTTQLFTLMPTWPADLDEGTRYVVFYSRTCDHCHELFYEHLAVDGEFAAKVAAIEIPEETDVMTAENAWPLPPDLQCEMLALPLGPNYIITSPVALRIENGVVTCATEGDHVECLELGH